MQNIWMRFLAGCLAVLVNLTTFSAVWAESAIDPKFQGIPLQCYMSLADVVDSPEAKITAYSEIATKYLELQYPDRAKQVLEKSLSVTEEIANPSLQAFTLLDTAERFIKVSQPQLAIAALDKALILAKDFIDPVDKVFSNIKIAQAYGEVDRKEKARTLLFAASKATPEIFDPYVRARSFSAIANVYTQIGDDFNSESAISAATDLLPMITELNLKARARVEIAGNYAQAGNHSKAIASLSAVFQEFDASRDRAIAQAKETAKQAEKIAAQNLAQKTKDKAILKTDPAAQSLNAETVKNDPPKIDTPKIDTQAMERAEIANAELLKTRSLFLVANQYLASKQYDKVLEVIHNLKDTSIEKSIGIANVAIAYVKDGQNDLALKLLNQSLQGLITVTPSIDMFTLLIEVGHQYRVLKENELADKTWEQALSIAQNLPQPAQRLFALNVIASAFGELGLANKVAPILQASLALAKTAPDANIRSRAFSDISSTYWAIGEYDLAKKLAEDIENSKDKDHLSKLFACAG